MTGLTQYPVNDNAEMLGYISNHRQYKWAENTSFHTTMTVLGTSRGRSSVKFHLESRDGRKWEMFVTDFCDLAKCATIVNGGVTGTWEVCKRGTNYGLRLAK